MRMKGKKPIFTKRDTWSLDMVLSPIICEGLKAFKENLIESSVGGVPNDIVEECEGDVDIGYERWLDILDEMIYAFDIDNELNICDYHFTFDFERTMDMDSGLVKGVSCTPDNPEEMERYKQDCTEHARMCKLGREAFANYYESLWI